MTRMIDRVVDLELSYPFSDNDIKLLINDKDARRPAEVSVPFVDYGQLSQMSGSEDLFGRAPDNVVILYWKTRPQFGHWTALIRDPAKKTIEHFDPLGFPLDLLLT